MNDYQKVLTKRISYYDGDKTLMLRLDSSFHVTYMSSAFSDYMLNVDGVNESMPPITDIFEPTAAGNVLMAIKKMLIAEKDGFVTDVYVTTPGKAIDAWAVVYKLPVNEDGIFAVYFSVKDSEDPLTNLGKIGALHTKLLLCYTFDNLNVPLSITKNSKIIYANKALAYSLGYKLSVLHSAQLSKIVSRNDADRVSQFEKRNYDAQSAENMMVSFPTQSTDLYTAYMAGAPCYTNSSPASLAFFIDQAESLKDKDSLNIYKGIFDRTALAMAIYNSKTNNINVNKAFSKLTGYKLEDGIELIQYMKTMPKYNETLEKTKCDGTKNIFTEFTRKNGSSFSADITLIYIEDNVFAFYIDNITQKLEEHRKLEEYRLRDYLTGVSNAVTFDNNLKKAFEQCKRDGKKLTLMMFDVDSYNEIYKTNGPDVANNLLKMISVRAKGYVGDVERIARFGESRFTIYFEAENDDEITNYVEEFVQIMDWPIVNGNSDFFITVSVGVGTYPDNAMSHSELHGFAKEALSYANKEKRSSYAIFTREHGIKVVTHQNTLEIDFLNAMNNNEFVVYYQPKAEVSTNSVVAAEALVRWESHAYGLVPPNSFIRLAEETGMIVPLGYKVIELVCSQLKDWREKGYKEIPISVNLSYNQLSDEHFEEKLKEITDRYNVSISQLDFQVSDANITNDRSVFNFIIDCRNKGIIISLDNFGTGKTSITQLEEYPLDRVTIDRSTMREVDNDKNSRDKLEAAIALAKRLNLRTIAEGVENTQQLDILKSLGCDLYQGYFLSKPVPNDAFENFIK